MPERPQHIPTAADLNLAVSQQLAAILAELRDIRQAVTRPAYHLAYGGADIEQRLQNWPVEGEERIIVSRRSTGSIFPIAAATFTDLLPVNAGRAGLQLINTGANPAFVFLATKGDAQGGAPAAGPAAPAIGTGWLSANGGTWDGKISDEVWCGAVSCFSTLGTTITVTQI